MKNIILGMIGGAVAIYLVVFCLSVYSISARKNEMENLTGTGTEYDTFLREYRQ